MSGKTLNQSQIFTIESVSKGMMQITLDDMCTEHVLCPGPNVNDHTKSFFPETMPSTIAQLGQRKG